MHRRQAIGLDLDVLVDVLVHDVDAVGILLKERHVVGTKGHDLEPERLAAS
jgi:hypothetical protein